MPFPDSANTDEMLRRSSLLPLVTVKGCWTVADSFARAILIRPPTQEGEKCQAFSRKTWTS